MFFVVTNDLCHIYVIGSIVIGNLGFPNFCPGKSLRPLNHISCLSILLFSSPLGVP